MIQFFVLLNCIKISQWDPKNSKYYNIFAKHDLWKELAVEITEITFTRVYDEKMMDQCLE